jgi:hypothetical protein
MNISRMNEFQHEVLLLKNNANHHTQARRVKTGIRTFGEAILCPSQALWFPYAGDDPLRSGPLTGLSFSCPELEKGNDARHTEKHLPRRQP